MHPLFFFYSFFFFVCSVWPVSLCCAQRKYEARSGVTWAGNYYWDMYLYEAVLAERRTAAIFGPLSGTRCCLAVGVPVLVQLISIDTRQSNLTSDVMKLVVECCF